MKDQNTINVDAGMLEEQRKELLDRMNQYLSDDLKKAIDVSFKLSKKEIPNPKLIFTNGSA